MIVCTFEWPPLSFPLCLCAKLTLRLILHGCVVGCVPIVALSISRFSSFFSVFYPNEEEARNPALFAANVQKVLGTLLSVFHSIVCLFDRSID